MHTVLFSVIVVSLNAENTIRDTIDSVLQQTCEDFEIIVKDGLSGDATLAVIPRDKRIHIVSEQDASVYDGMNQAIRYASGKYIIFMNCGDRFYSNDVLEVIAENVSRNHLDGREVLYGNYFLRGAEHKQVPEITRQEIVSAGLCHQTVFCGRVLFEEYGLLDSDMRICADHEHLARLFVNGVPIRYVDKIICEYQGGGLSEQTENIKTVREEGNLIRKRYFQKKDILIYICNRLKKKLLRIMGRLQ